MACCTSAQYSTSIVVLADEIYAAGAAGSRAPLTTLSAIFPGLPCDESAVIAATWDPASCRTIALIASSSAADRRTSMSARSRKGWAG